MLNQGSKMLDEVLQIGKAAGDQGGLASKINYFIAKENHR